MAPNLCIGTQKTAVNRPFNFVELALIIYDISGRKVKTIGVSEAQHPDGPYSVSIGSLPAGVYSCSLILEGKVINRSFVKM